MLFCRPGTIIKRFSEHISVNVNVNVIVNVIVNVNGAERERVRDRRAAPNLKGSAHQGALPN